MVAGNHDGALRELGKEGVKKMLSCLYLQDAMNHLGLRLPPIDIVYSPATKL